MKAKPRYMIIVLLFAIFTSTLNGQVSKNEAFQIFKKAREAYKNGKFEISLNLLLKTKELLGSSNIRIQPMLIKSLVGVEDWRQAKIEVITYYGLNPDKEIVEYQEIVNIEKNIDNKIYEEEQFYTKAKNKRTTTAYYEYLKNYPNGKYVVTVRGMIERWDKESYKKAVSEGSQESLNYYLTNYQRGKYIGIVRRKLIERKEYDVYIRAKNTDSFVGYKAYIDKYPNGKYVVIAKGMIERWDKEAYEKAISEGSQEYLNYYLTNYKRGRYVSIVRKKLVKRKEYDVYMYAKKTARLEDYKAYINKYPYGKYSSGVNKIIGNSYYKSGQTH